MSKDYVRMSISRLEGLLQDLHRVKSLLSSSNIFVETENLEFAIRKIEAQVLLLKNAYSQAVVEAEIKADRDNVIRNVKNGVRKNRK